MQCGIHIYIVSESARQRATKQDRMLTHVDILRHVYPIINTATGQVQMSGVDRHIHVT